MIISALAVCFVVEPVTVIQISVSMIKLALSACLILVPKSLVSGAIRPDLDAIPLFALSKPLPLINRSILEDDLSGFLSGLARLDTSSSIIIWKRFILAKITVLIMWICRCFVVDDSRNVPLTKIFASEDASPPSLQHNYFVNVSSKVFLKKSYAGLDLLSLYGSCLVLLPSACNTKNGQRVRVATLVSSTNGNSLLTSSSCPQIELSQVIPLAHCPIKTI